MQHKSPGSTARTSWPYASLLFLGIFGAEDEAGKQASRRGGVGLLLLIVGFILVQVHGVVPVQVVGGAILIGSVLFIIWSTARYLGALDELSRLIQLEAFAWTYGGLLLLAFAAVALGGGPRGVSIGPHWIIVGELLRGLALVFVARRYR